MAGAAGRRRGARRGAGGAGTRRRAVRQARRRGRRARRGVLEPGRARGHARDLRRARVRKAAVAVAAGTRMRLLTWGAPKWPPTPPSVRTRPGEAGARLGITPCAPRARTRPGEAGARLGIALLVALGGLLIAAPAHAAESYERVAAIVHVHSDLSTGDFPLEELTDMAERQGLGAVLLSENYLTRVEYSLPPFRALTRVAYESRSVRNR